MIPVLLYHSISDHPTPGAWGVVTPGRFAEHVEAIWHSGRHPVTVTEIARALRSEIRLPERSVAVTFDDGFSDNAWALALLGSRGLKATIYLTTGDLGTEGRLTRAEVSDLATLPGVELGAHAVHHVALDELEDFQIRAEVRESRRELAELIGRPVASFAYPHGAFDRRVRAAVQQAGYSSAAAVKNALSHAADDPFAIARWTVTEASSTDRIAAVLEGRGVALASGRERLRTRGYRLVRRTRRRFHTTRGDLWTP